jgi:broad specificity phosphatase PhoE
MTRLYLIRHGETEWNRENRTQGCSKDQPLSEKGLAQAKAVAERFRNNPIDVIYSSDLIRAYCTAKEISNIIGSPIKRTEILREMNFGCCEGVIKGNRGELQGYP